MATILLPKVNQKSLSSKDERESRDVKTGDFRRTVDDLLAEKYKVSDSDKRQVY